MADAVHRHPGRNLAEARALEVLRKVRMAAAETRLDDHPLQLSGGMRQRV